MRNKFQAETPPDRKTRKQKRERGDDAMSVAKQLIGMQQSDVDKLDLDDLTRRTLDEARSTNAHVAKKRAEKRLAGLLREDGLDEVLATLNSWQEAHRKGARTFAAVEKIRNNAVDADSDDDAIAIVAKALKADLDDDWTQAVIDARKEHNWRKPKGAKKRLFQKLNDALV